MPTNLGSLKQFSQKCTKTSNIKAPPNLLEILISQPLSLSPLSKGIINPSLDCFMISSLQCLFSISKFTTHFSKPAHHKGPVATQIKLLLERMKTSSAVKLEDFRDLFNEDFSKSEQHDANQFLMTLFDKIKEEESPGIKKFLNGGYKDAREAWSVYKKTNTSIVDKLFVGMYETVMECGDCGQRVRVYEEFRNIPYYISNESSFDKLKQFSILDEVKGPARFKCESCKRIINGSMKKRVINYPQFLILAFQRFNCEEQTKIQTTIEYPEKIERGVKGDTKFIYNLQSVICHSGDADSGHYTAYSKRGKYWKFFDDDKVIKTDKSKVLNHRNAYILIYSTSKTKIN